MHLLDKVKDKCHAPPRSCNDLLLSVRPHSHQDLSSPKVISVISQQCHNFRSMLPCTTFKAA